MATHAILLYLFDNKPHPLARPLSHWMAEAPRFAAFVQTYRDKIRKKIRGLRDIESWRDLQTELDMAYLLLQEQQFVVAYEPYVSGKTRGPDFAVTFRTHYTFNIEVTRMRAPRQPIPSNGAPQPPVSAQQAAVRRLCDIIVGKLGQLQPGMANLLVVTTERRAFDELDLALVMQRLKERIERRDPDLYGRYGLRAPADFFKSYQCLSGLLLRYSENGNTSTFGSLWPNNQARHPLPGQIRTRLQK